MGKPEWGHPSPSLPLGTEPAMYDPATPQPTLFPTGGPEDHTLYYGDCLDWMSQWESESVDLIYLDPPFNSSAGYNVLFTDRGAGKAQYRAFDDTWHWTDHAETRLQVYQGAGARPAARAVQGLHKILGRSGMLAYLTYMAERLEEMQRLLKPTGSIYLHCDDTAVHSLKLLADSIFGVRAFRNEIVWKRTGSHSDSKRFGRTGDRILFYGSSGVNRDAVRVPLSRKYVKQKYRYQDARGLYREDNLTAKGLTGGGYHYDFHGHLGPWRYPESRMLVLEADDRIHFPKKVGGVPAFKRYLSGNKGRHLSDIWTDIAPLNPRARERLGYPTQKPRVLLERIIKASTNEGDLVLDPFCGCGTAVDAANRLGRRWAGIDISSFAIDLIRDRRMADHDVTVKGTPFDLRGAEKLAREKPFEFESWAIMRMPGFVPNTVRVGDGGIDGRATLATKPADHKSRLALAQVKGGKFNLSQLRDFVGVTDAQKAALGIYVTLKPVTSPGAKIAAYGPGNVTVGAEQYPRCQLWSIADYFDDRRPHLPTMTDPYTGKPLVQGEMFA